MKLKQLEKIINTDSLVLTCKGETASFDGDLFDAFNRFGEKTVVRITPGDNFLDIEIK